MKQEVSLGSRQLIKQKLHTRLSQFDLTRQVKIVILLMSFESASRQSSPGIRLHTR